MQAGEIIAIVVVALIVIGATLYIIKAKKSGAKCIGCPHCSTCHPKKNKKGKSNDENSCCCCGKKD